MKNIWKNNGPKFPNLILTISPWIHKDNNPKQDKHNENNTTARYSHITENEVENRATLPKEDTLAVDFPGSRSVRIKCLMFKPLSL